MDFRELELADFYKQLGEDRTIDICDVDSSLFKTNRTCGLLRDAQKIDDQGIKWSANRITRDQYRKRRIQNFFSFRNETTLLGRNITKTEIDYNIDSQRTYYQHRFTKRDPRVATGHFQLLRNVKAVSPFNVYFAVDQGVAHYNARSQEKPEIVIREEDPGFSMPTFDMCEDLVCFGSQEGQLYIYK